MMLVFSLFKSSLVFYFLTILHSFEKSRFTRKFSTPLKLSSEPIEPSFFYSKNNFEDIGASKAILNVVNHFDFNRPSRIQSLSFGHVLNGKDCIIADQTGSGKTLAYLLPLIQKLIENIKTGKLSSVESRKPYIVIITPTTELAYQVSKVARAVSNVLKFRTACVTSTSDVDGEQKKLRLGTEILVVTPGRLLALLKRKEISLEKTQALVLDEADVLFLDQSFPLQQIGASCTNATQFIFATATLPDIVTKQIKLEFPNVELIKGPGLHRIAPTIEEVLVDCSSPPSQMRSPSITFEMKKQALFKAFDDVKSDRTLIFCNTIDSCRNVENALSRVDRNQRIRSVYACHGAIDPKVREQSIQSFSKRNLKIPAVMICTDRASRGIDFDQANVDHVILFDFPQEPSEYVRRVGRTGRAGRFGRATILVYGRQVPIAKEVIGATSQGKKIDPVPEMTNFESWGF